MGARGRWDCSMVHKAESEIQRRAGLQGTQGCIIWHILYSVYRVCIQAQTLCINIYMRLYIYICTHAVATLRMLFFTLIFS